MSWVVMVESRGKWNMHSPGYELRRDAEASLSRRGHTPGVRDMFPDPRDVIVIAEFVGGQIIWPDGYGPGPQDTAPSKVIA